MQDDTPTADELAVAPIIEGWELRRAVLSTDRQQVHGIFHGHPEIANGTRGHSSDIVRIDQHTPPRWAVCASRTYRLGTPRI